MWRKGGGGDGTVKRTDGVLGGRVDDGDAAAQGGLAPPAADEEAAARDRWGRSHGYSTWARWMTVLGGAVP